jgi:ribosomal protein S1
VGQRLKVKVLDLNPEEEKLIVSEKKIADDEQTSRVAAHHVGEVHEGPITALTDFGAFLEFAEGITGLIHISELAWQRVEHPSDVVKVGDVVRAEIINLNGAKVFLSRKRLLPDPWKTVEERYRVGQVVTGKVLKVNPFGLFIELDPEIHGLCHVSELDLPEPATDAVKVGEAVTFKIISLHPAEHRLGLSRRALREPAAPAGEPAAPAAVAAPDPALAETTAETPAEPSA